MPLFNGPRNKHKVCTFRKAFTLIEVLISIALLGIMIPVLYSSVDVLQESNSHVLEYLQKSKKITKATETLYLDILSSDGNISIQKDEYTRLCIENSKNSLYELSLAKVCWVVLKKDKALARIEGNGYSLPLGTDQRAEIDVVMKGVELFDVYHSKDKVLVLLQEKGKEPISFLIQGVTKPKKKKLKKKRMKKRLKSGKKQGGNTPQQNGKQPSQNNPNQRDSMGQPSNSRPGEGQQQFPGDPGMMPPDEPRRGGGFQDGGRPPFENRPPQENLP